MWTSRVGSDARMRIDQLEGRSPESCLSWLRLHKRDVQNMIYSCCSILVFIITEECNSGPVGKKINLILFALKP